MFMLRYITCYAVMLYNMFCCVMFMLRYRTCNVYVMLYNMLYLCYITCYVMFYNMSCYVMLC